MIITHLSLRNWRNFQTVDVDLGDRVFLIGPNAAGKSNLLDALLFLRDIAKTGGGLAQAVEDRGGVSKIRCLAAKRYPDIEIDVTLSDDSDTEDSWRYAIGVKQENAGRRRTLLTYEHVWRNGIARLERPDSEDDKDPERLTQTYLQQVNANKDFREVVRFFDTILYLHLVPQLLRHPNAFSGPGLPGDPFGKNFMERLAKTTERTRRARLKKIELALVRAVPQLRNLSYVKDEMGLPHLEAVYKHWRAQGAKQREDQFSDGTLRLIGLLWSLMESDSLLLLEEPELSLNSGIVRKLPSMLHRMQRDRRRQVIISTHSPDLLSDPGIGGEEVLLLTPDVEGTKVEPLSSIREVHALLRGGVNVADAALAHTVPETVRQLDLSFQ